MIEKENVQKNESEVSLLDMLLVVAENLKLLVLGPLAVGLLALGISFAMPQSYTSEAILALPTASSLSSPAPNAQAAQAAAMMSSPLVLDPVIQSLNLSGGRPIQVARKTLATQIKATVGKDGLLRLDVTANTPTEAQNIANTVIDIWLKSTVPGADERFDLEKRLESAKFSLEAVDRLLKRLTTEGSTSLNQPLTRGEAGTSIVAISELQLRYLGEVLTIPRTLRGASSDVVKQRPTLPTETVAPKKGMIAILATLGSGIVFLLYIFVRRSWEKSADNLELAKKQSRLLAAIGFKNRTH